ncbi:MAG: hypothetical protein WAN93_09050 [Solirubrobacteraceae bacterium]
MAYFTSRGNGAWEVRESRLTAAGPRSRTLATFKELTPEIAERARERSSQPLDVKDLRDKARRAGVPVAPSVGDRASAQLIAELAAGRSPRPALVRLLLGALQAEGKQSDNAEAAAAWITATPQRRGDTLRDLLLLVDSLPRRRARERERFPRIQSHAA